MRCRGFVCVVALTSLAALAAACGGDKPDAADGGGPRQQFAGRVSPPTPTLAPALAEATKVAAPFVQVYGGGGAGTGELTAAQATEHIGKQGKVCGTVMSTVHEPEHQSKVTFLNIDKAEDPDFFVYFWHSGKRVGDWPDISDASVDLTNWFNGKKICAEGLIQKYREKPGINAGSWAQISFQEE